MVGKHAIADLPVQHLDVTAASVKADGDPGPIGPAGIDHDAAERLQHIGDTQIGMPQS